MNLFFDFLRTYLIPGSQESINSSGVLRPVKRIVLLFCLFTLLVLDFKTFPPTIINRIATERTFLHTDRKIYIAGEYIFFKIYIIDLSTQKLSTISKIGYLVIRNKENKSILKIRMKIDKGTAYGSIAIPDTLSSGPYRLTTFTNWMRNEGEEFFFNKEIFIANRFDQELFSLGLLNVSSFAGTDSASEQAKTKYSLTVSSDKTDYNKRDKINLGLKLSDNVRDVSARLSVSVYEKVPGIQENLSLFNYLLVSANTSVSSKFTASENHIFLPETKGEIINGEVIDEVSNRTIANSCVLLSVADSVVNLQYCISDANGLFRFLLNDYYQGREIIFNIRDNAGNKKIRIELQDKFALNTPLNLSKHNEYLNLIDYIHKSQDIVTIQKIYKAVRATEIYKPFKVNIICPKIYYKPDYKIYPSDFVPLNDFAEISREILPSQLKLRKNGDKYDAVLADENLHTYMDQEPAVFLDGVYIEDVNKIIQLGSDKIKSVDLVCSRYNYGELVFPGILAVFSKKNEIKNIPLNFSSHRMQLEAFHPYSVLNTTEYSNGTSEREPDFRQLLYWNPTLEIYAGQNLELEFYASDHSGNYMIRIEGITSGGVPISVSKMIKVK